MAERRKGKKRTKEEAAPVSSKEAPSKEEYSVAKWMKKNVPTKKTKFLSHNVEYFTSSKAIDLLLDSAWATRQDPLFTTRESVVEFLDLMLRNKFFHRAKKIPVSESELRGHYRKKKCGGGKSSGGEEGEGGEKEVSKKRKIRLDMHLQQVVVDGAEAYVWLYDPVPPHYWLIGGLLVVGAIAICLFPLWPPIVRQGVYYLSVGAAGVLVVIIGLAVVRVVVFCLLWLLTLGRHHLWLLPNLTEDVGFFASFWPLWKYEYHGPSSAEDRRRKSRAKGGRDSQAEEDDNDSHPDAPQKALQDQETADRDKGSEGEEGSESEGSSSGQKSQPERDFEMVDPPDEGGQSGADDDENGSAPEGHS